MTPAEGRTAIRRKWKYGLGRLKVKFINIRLVIIYKSLVQVMVKLGATTLVSQRLTLIHHSSGFSKPLPGKTVRGGSSVKTTKCCPFRAQFQSDSTCEELKCDITLSSDKAFGKRKVRQGEETGSFLNTNIKEDLCEKMMFDKRPLRRA